MHKGVKSTPGYEHIKISVEIMFTQKLIVNCTNNYKEKTATRKSKIVFSCKKNILQ